MLLIFTVSCDSIVEIEIEDVEKLIVVNSVISPDSPISVNLSLTRHILDNAEIQQMIPPKYNPNIKLFVNNEYSEDLAYNEITKKYVSSFKPQIGDSYSIEIIQDGYEPVTATSVIPENVKIVSIDTATIDDDPGGSSYNGGYGVFVSDENLHCEIEIDDPEGVKNYYMISMSADVSRMEWRDTSYYVVDSVFFNEIWYTELREVTSYEKYTRYLNENLLFSSGDLSILFHDYQGYVLDDSFFDGKKYSIKTKIPVQNLYSLDSAIVTIKVKTLSEDYFRYLNTRFRHYSSKDDFFTTPVIVYDNIEGGVGVMGAYSTDSLSFSVSYTNPWENREYIIYE
ncbi:MAG: DUF4249 domain-containing protein [Bacteroidales bacterium]|nr:DUF4249 domain-containing protein [Bacteroidales bacterium]MBN2818126.1 DUF4249 domain-containing protein [Bacteroidales bacterium]